MSVKEHQDFGCVNAIDMNSSNLRERSLVESKSISISSCLDGDKMTSLGAATIRN